MERWRGVRECARRSKRGWRMERKVARKDMEGAKGMHDEAGVRSLGAMGHQTEER